MTRPPRLDHQSLVIRHMLDHDRWINSLGTGMGKTRAMIEAGWLLHKRDPSKLGLYLVPNSTIEQWEEEFVTWMGEDYLRFSVVSLRAPLSRETRADALRMMAAHSYADTIHVVLLPHEDVSSHPIAQQLRNIRWGYVMVDESSRFRNHSKRSRNLVLLGKHADRRYVASGTMITKSPLDVWYTLQFLGADKILPSYFHGKDAKQLFMQHFCVMGGWMNAKPIDLRDERKEELAAILDPWRTQLSLSDVRKMPARILQTRYVDLYPEQRKAYEELHDTLQLEIEGMDDYTFSMNVATYVSRMQKLQEIAAGFARSAATGDIHQFSKNAKLDELLELLEDPIPTVVWTLWVPEMEAVTRALRDRGFSYSCLADRDGRERFLAGDTDVLVSQVAAGGYGLNLDRARRLIYLSLPWDLDVYAQSQERNWRWTTTEPKTIIHILSRQTIDQKVKDRLAGKASMAQKMTRSQALAMLTSTS